MHALLYALANLARLRWLGVAFCAFAIVCATTNVNANAPGTQHEQTKTRVGGFEQNSPLNVCANALASAETHRGISSAQCETASAFSHAAKGAEGLIGRALGKLGTVVANPGIKVTSFGAEHALMRAASRGVSQELILNTVANPGVVLHQAGDRFLFLTSEAAVVTTRSGEVVTAYGSAQFKAHILDLLSAAGLR